jgi:FkbM family methyltransferase
MALGDYVSTVLDIGSRWGTGDAWWRIQPLASVIGFEPDADECDRLNRSSASPARERYIPLALGSTAGTAFLYRTAQPACSSLYRPLEHLADRYPSLAGIRPDSMQEIEVVTLDEWSRQEGVAEVTFMKLDAQGSELDILRGGRGLLQSCVGVEVEVEFSPIYEGQPQFSDVDQFLREQGFVLWRLSHRCHYSELNLGLRTRDETTHFGGADISVKGGSGRLFWADAVYFRDYGELLKTEVEPSRLLILAALLSSLGDVEAGSVCLLRCVEKWPDRFTPSVRNELTNHARLLVAPPRGWNRSDHGPAGIRSIARDIRRLARSLTR